MRQICLVGSKIMRPNHDYDTIYFLHLKLEIKMILLLINLEKVFEKLWKEKGQKKGNIKNVKKYQTNLSQSCDSNHFKHMIIRFSYKLSSSSSAAVIKAKGGQTKYILPLFFNRIATLIKLQNIKEHFTHGFRLLGPTVHTFDTIPQKIPWFCLFLLHKSYYHQLYFIFYTLSV